MMHSRRLATAALCAASLTVPATAQAATAYETAVLADGPIVHFRMDEAAGATVAADASGQGRDGTYVSAVLGVPAPFGDAGTAVSLPAAGRVTATVPEASGSAEFWINPGRLKRNEQAGYLSHGDPAGDGWALGVGAKRKLAFVSRGVRTATKITIPNSVWTLVDATWTATEVRVYLNGVLAKSFSRSVAAPVSSRGDLVVGGDGSGSFTGNLAGSVDELALYSQVLTAADVADHFSAAHLPVNSAAPSIAGTLQVGQTLSVVAGTWSDATPPFTYQWQRCDADGLDCADVDGATGTTYLLTAADAGSTLQVVETAANASGASYALSGLTGVVADLPPGGGGGDTGGGTGGDTGGGTGGGTGGDTGGGTGGTGGDTGGGTTGGDTTGGGTTGGDTTGGGTTGGDPTGGTPTPGTGTPETAAGCLTVGKVRTAKALRKLGRLRLKGRSACLAAKSPLRITFRAKSAGAVRITLDGKRVRLVRSRGKLKAVVKPARLRPGRHALVVRVKPRQGKVRTAKVRLRTVRR